MASCRFNPRARVGRDLRSDTRATLYSVFQSTRPRGARLLVFEYKVSSISVSIHAPAWGATPYQEEYLGHKHVSIHAPAWGATRLGSG